MSVTEFRDYLACPYRYALRHRLRLQRLSDHARELDAGRFGTLAHRVLEAFGSDPDAADAADPAAIEAFLLDTLARLVRELFGREPMPAVQVQAARLAQRLQAFARVQSVLRREGWRIDAVELAFDGRVALDIPGQAPMPLRAKIDRVDRHERTGERRIIDYKTGEGGRTPHAAHHGTESIGDGSELPWLDLQLPLYRYLVCHAFPGPDPQLGYLVLPRKASDVAVRLGGWRTEQLEAGLDAARRIVQLVRAGSFPLNPEHHWSLDPFARICQTTAYREDEIAADEGAARIFTNAGGGDGP
jgi:hypothetical protein